MKITVDAEIEVNDVLNALSDEELLERLSSRDLVCELQDRQDLYEAIDKFSDIDLIDELIHGRNCDQELLEYLDDAGYLDKYKAEAPELYGVTTNDEKNTVRKYLCDIFNVNYHTSSMELIEMLKSKLI
jgi:hypothetical protein